MQRLGQFKSIIYLLLASSVFFVTGAAAQPINGVHNSLKNSTISRELAAKADLEGTVLKIESHLRNSGESLALVAYDIRNDREIISLNKDNPMQMASLVKPLTATAVLLAVHYNRIPYDEALKKDLEASIKLSDNLANNRLMLKVGGPKGVQDLLQEYHPNIFARVSIVEEIPDHGKTYKNKAPATAYVEFLKGLNRRTLLPKKMAEELLDLFNYRDEPKYNTNPENIERFRSFIPRGYNVHSFSQIPAHVGYYQRTGSTSMLCGVMALVNDTTTYIFVGLIQGKERIEDDDGYNRWISSRADFLRQISGAVNRYTKLQFYQKKLIHPRSISSSSN